MRLHHLPTAYRAEPGLRLRRDPQPPPAEAAVLRFLKGFHCEEADLWEASSVRLLDSTATDAKRLLSTLYSPDECVTIALHSATTDDGVQSPPWGETAKRSEWISRLTTNGLDASISEAWIQLNPFDGNETEGNDEAAFRFALLEFGSIPIALQLPFVARLPLAISAIITGDRDSLHVWVNINAKSAIQYRDTVSRLFALLRPLGATDTKGDPVQWSRLPWLYQQTNANKANRHRLLYLNAAPKAQPIAK